MPIQYKIVMLILFIIALCLATESNAGILDHIANIFSRKPSATQNQTTYNANDQGKTDEEMTDKYSPRDPSSPRTFNPAPSTDQAIPDTTGSFNVELRRRDSIAVLNPKLVDTVARELAIEKVIERIKELLHHHHNKHTSEILRLTDHLTAKDMKELKTYLSWVKRIAHTLGIQVTQIMEFYAIQPTWEGNTVIINDQGVIVIDPKLTPSFFKLIFAMQEFETKCVHEGVYNILTNSSEKIDFNKIEKLQMTQEVKKHLITQIIELGIFPKVKDFAKGDITQHTITLFLHELRKLNPIEGQDAKLNDLLTAWTRYIEYRHTHDHYTVHHEWSINRLWRKIQHRRVHNEHKGTKNVIEICQEELKLLQDFLTKATILYESSDINDKSKQMLIAALCLFRSSDMYSEHISYHNHKKSLIHTVTLNIILGAGLGALGMFITHGAKSGNWNMLI